MRTCLTEVILNPLVLLAVGLSLVVLGGSLAADAPATMSRIRHAEQAIALSQATRGQPAWIEGRIGSSSPPIYRGYVAYVREEYRSCGRSSCWREVARQTPPLVVEQPPASEQYIANHDYSLASTASTTNEAAPTTFKGTVRSRGFKPGDPIFALGRPAEDGARQVLDADFVYAGTRRQYIEAQRVYAARALPVGSAGLLAGTLCMLGGAWQLRQFVLEVRQNPALPAPRPASLRKGSRRRKPDQKQ